MQIQYYVKDKEGNELGCLTARLSRMELEKGATKEHTVCWEESYPVEDQFFVDLYNTDLEDLVLECKITRINFDDGYTTLVDEAD